MSDEHAFCRALLRETREAARQRGIKIPRGLSALKASDGKQWFIEAKEDSPRVYVKGDCTYSAKAQYIHDELDRIRRARSLPTHP